MANIIQIQNDLRNYSDEQLADAVNTPVAGVPQYLVLTEMNRRRTLRESADAADPQPETTIAEELSVSPSPYGAPPPTVPASVQPGFPALANANQVPGGGVPPAFANGGFVSDPSNPFAALAGRLTALEAASGNARRDARNIALANLGFGMARSTSPFFGQAIGEGGLAGAEAFRQARRDMRADEMDILRQHIALAQAQATSDMARQRFDLSKQRLDLQRQQLDKPSAVIENYEYFQGLDPEDQRDFLRLRGGSAANSFKTLDEVAKLREKTRQDLLKPEVEGGRGWADRLTAARAEGDIAYAKARREFDQEVDNTAMERYPHRAAELGMFAGARTGREGSRGLNLVGTPAAGPAQNIQTIELSPTKARGTGKPGEEEAEAAAEETEEVNRTLARTLNPRGLFESKEDYEARIDKIVKGETSLFMN